ncbi:MAG: AGE family epimerase/isomerase [Rhodothermales bacterium]
MFTRSRRPRTAYPLFLIALFVLLVASGCDTDGTDAVRSGSQVTAEVVHEALQRHVLGAWYPRAVDADYGGYLSDFAYDWRPDGPQDKFIETQARHVWTLARAAEFEPDRRETYLGYAARGVDFLRDHMWDAEQGGFVPLVTRDGTPRGGENGFTQRKTAYGNAFGVYGLAAYADVSGEASALRFAQDAFTWMEEHLHDPEHGGYFQFVDADGAPIRDGSAGRPPKDQNSSIHVLEALTELYGVWPDPLVRERLEEMLTIVRDTIVGEPPYLRLFFQADWTPVSFADSSRAAIEEHIGLDHVSFGHDVETAFLMLEAARALEQDPAPTLDVGKRMVDHALDHGWDEDVGGIFDGAYYFDATPEIVLDGKAWWAQVEMMNTMLLMADLYPDDERDYMSRFEDMWQYIEEYLIDHDYGGVYAGGLDREPEAETAPKGNIWKAGYHDGRALMHVTERLRSRE